MLPCSGVYKPYRLCPANILRQCLALVIFSALHANVEADRSPHFL